MTDGTYIWENLFPEHIRWRGFDYYSNGHVGDITRKTNVLSASVIGTRIYSVKIRLRDEKPENMACSCPYAEGGLHCKHMAAVLYQWEEEREAVADAAGEDAYFAESTFLDEPEHCVLSPEADYPSGKGADNNPAAMVANADEVLVRKFLAMVLKENESYKNRFRLLTGADFSAEDMRRYRNRIDRIVKSYMGCEKFITCDRAGEFEIDMESFMDEEVMAMVDNGYLKDAFDLTLYIFRILPGLDIDDSCGETSMLAESCVKYWEMIAEAADEDLQTTMFDECVVMLEDEELDIFWDYVDAFLAEFFHAPKLLKRKLDYAAEMCAFFAKRQEEGRAFITAEVWIRRYLKLLADLDTPDEQIDTICRKYWQTETARQFAADRYIKRGDYEDAEKVLLECLDTFELKNQSQRSYSNQLLDLYQKSGQKEKYTALPKSIVMTHRAGDMVMYRTLKAQCKPEEWKEILSVLLNAPAWENYRQQIYEQEGMKKKLLDMVCKYGSLYMAERYTELLKSDYPEELLDVYERGLRKAAENAGTRNTYREWAHTLQKMKKISGGEERVRIILKDWRLRYSTRPAMMDELRHV